MSLKYELIKVDNPKFKETKDKVDKTSRALAKLKQFSRYIDKTNDPEDGLVAIDYDTRFTTTVTNEIKRLKKQLAVLPTASKTLKKLKVSSDKEWTFYNESIHDEFGITKYDTTPTKVTVNGVYDFNNGEESLKEIKRIKDKAIALVKEHRRLRRELQFEEKTFKVADMPYASKFKAYYSGGNTENVNNKYVLHMVPGEIMRLQKETKLRNIFKAKKPLTKENHVGIEIEFVCKMDKFDVAKLLDKHGVADHVHLLDDASLRAEGEYKFTHELTVLAPESKVREVIKGVTDAINEADSKVNARCGLHVHLDVRNRDKSVVFNNLVKAQTVLYAMNPKGRMDGTKTDGQRDTAFSRPVTTADFDECLENMGGGGREDRYLGINPLSFRKHSTIEVRLHSGSTNFDKIFNWVCILVNIANSQTKFKTEVTKIDSFCERFELNNVLEEYINSRIAKFKNKKGEHINLDEAV